MNLLFAATLLMQDKSADEIFKKLEDSLLGAKSVHVEFKLTVVNNGKSILTGSGSLFLKEGNKLNYTILSLEEGIHDKEYHFVSNGSKIKGSYYRIARGKIQELEQETPDDLLSNFTAGVCKAGVGGLLADDAATAFLGVLGPNPQTVPLRWKETLHVSGLSKGEDEKDGLKVIRYGLRLSANTSAPVAEMKVWIDPKSSLPVRRIFKIGEDIVTETYETFTLNGDTTDEKFKIPDKDK
jgi:outer membrane lipoprotein-sorting protein